MVSSCEHMIYVHVTMQVCLHPCVTMNVCLHPYSFFSPSAELSPMSQACLGSVSQVWQQWPVAGPVRGGEAAAGLGSVSQIMSLCHCQCADGLFPNGCVSVNKNLHQLLVLESLLS